MKTNLLNDDALWVKFAKKAELTTDQLDQFKTLYQMLKDANEMHNLTSKTDLNFVINYHFLDSLALGKAIALNDLNFISDIGTGGGFPGLPLKIKYPHLKMVLIEVTNKKIWFLETVIKALNLQDVEIYDQDWRTFLRKTENPIDLFCCRASLQPSELVRAFKPSSPYKNAKIVYWASESWSPELDVEPFIQNKTSYFIDGKKRFLVSLKKSEDAAKDEELV